MCCDHCHGSRKDESWIRLRSVGYYFVVECYTMQCSNGAATETGTCFTIRYKTRLIKAYLYFPILGCTGISQQIPDLSAWNGLPNWSILPPSSYSLCKPSSYQNLPIFTYFASPSCFPTIVFPSVTPSPSENLTLSSSLLPLCLTSDVSKSCYSVHFV